MIKKRRFKAGEVLLQEGGLGEMAYIIEKGRVEVTRRDETRPQYFSRLRDRGTKQAKLLKVADRISNLTDLHATVFDPAYVERYVAETEEYIYPMALEVDANMAKEVRDLMDRRRQSMG